MVDGERLNWPNVVRHVAAATLIRGNGCIAVHSPCVAPGRGWERCHNWVRGLKHKSGILRPIGESSLKACGDDGMIRVGLGPGPCSPWKPNALRGLWHELPGREVGLA